MESVRTIASAALARRAETGIKVRQPLATLTISSDKTTLTSRDTEYLAILKDEINVKEVIFKKGMSEDILLDTVITHALREEGLLRELVRVIQDLRQDAGLRMKDAVSLLLDGPEEIRFITEKNEMQLKKDVGAKSLTFGHSPKIDAEIHTKIDEWDVWVGLKK
jgi:isoleucyl-tRNA synthetase